MFIGKSNPMKLLTQLPKIQSTIQKSLKEFSQNELTKEFHSGLIKIKFKGDEIKEIDISDELQGMISDDKEMGSDLIVSAIKSMNAFVNEERMKKLEKDAKESGVDPSVVAQVFSNPMVSSLM
jgi:DNA-binding protein YbaB